MLELNFPCGTDVLYYYNIYYYILNMFQNLLRLMDHPSYQSV